MKLHELEHIVRAAAAITNQYEIVVVGSQSIVGSVPDPPAECMVSVEADVFPLANERMADLIDGAIGEGSPFHETFGYYAQGVDSTTSVLPNGWKDRLVRLQSERTDGKIGYCLDPTDLFLAKCAANREKDRAFNTALLRHRIVTAAAARSRVEAMPLSDVERQRVSMLISRLEAAAGIQHPSSTPIPRTE